jgi:hypothetical protein
MKNALIATTLVAAFLATAAPTAQAETCTLLNSPIQIGGFAGFFACAGVANASSAPLGGGSFTLTAVGEGEGQGTPGVTGTVAATLTSGSGTSGSSCGATGVALAGTRWSCTTGATTLTVTGTAGAPCATFVVTSKTFDTVLSLVNGGPVVAVDTTSVNC